MALRLLAPVVMLALAVGCDDGGIVQTPPPDPPDPVVAGVDLDVLLAPPTPDERESVADQLEQRAEAVVPVDVRIEAERSDGDATLTVLSFTTPFPDGTGRFYGAVRTPPRPPGSLLRSPLLVVVPERDGSVSTDEFLTAGPTAQLGADFIQVLFAAPGEALRVGSTEFRSAPVPDPYFAPYDFEVDLLRAFVQVALDAQSDVVDLARIGYLGFGRGGTVALLLGTRPDAPAYPFRPVAVAALAPFADYAAPSFRTVVRSLLLDQASRFPASDPIAERFLIPLRERTLPQADVREAFLRWSPLYVADALPEAYLRHPRPDFVIGSDHSARLASALTGRVNFLFLDEADHESLATNEDVLRRAASFLIDQVADAD